jgi:hypothetical protein
MKIYGWLIKYAKSLLELIGAMKDAIIGIFAFAISNVLYGPYNTFLGCFKLEQMGHAWWGTGKGHGGKPESESQSYLVRRFSREVLITSLAADSIPNMITRTRL